MRHKEPHPHLGDSISKSGTFHSQVQASVASSSSGSMLQFPAFMRQYPSPPLIPSSTLLPVWAQSHNDEILLAMVESELEDKWKEIRNANSDIVVIGKIKTDNKEEVEQDIEEDDADNGDESEGDEFEQETG